MTYVEYPLFMGSYINIRYIYRISVNTPFLCLLCKIFSTFYCIVLNFVLYLH